MEGTRLAEARKECYCKHRMLYLVVIILFALLRSMEESIGTQILHENCMFKITKFLVYIQRLFLAYFHITNV